jgi:hypothetical protein
MQQKSTLLILCISILGLVSCQKEIDWAINNGTSGGGTGGSSNGELLIKANQVTNVTNDLNVLTFQWDTNKRLLLYKSSGKVNGIATDISYRITRLADGKIKNIVGKTSATTAFVDSTVYFPHYTGSRMDYVIDTQYTSVFGPLRDSIAFNYNASGQIIVKETYADIFGFLTQSSKETYQYDATGNITVITILAPDGAGGFLTAATVTHTYDGHKAAVTMGEECYIALGASNISKNNLVKAVTAAAGSTSYTGTFSSQVFNSFDRPTKADLGVTPVPPGYSMKLEYFYQ